MQPSWVTGAQILQDSVEACSAEVFCRPRRGKASANARLASPPVPPLFIAGFATRRPATQLNRGDGRLALLDLEPAAAVGAHVLDQRDEGAALVGELIGDARRDLGKGAALDDALLLERPQAKRKGARADALQRALQFTEPERGIREIADDQEGPLAGDDLRRTADGTFTVHHGARIAAKLYFVKRCGGWIRRSRRLALDRDPVEADLVDLHPVGLAVHRVDHILGLAWAKGKQRAIGWAGDAGALSAELINVLREREIRALLVEGATQVDQRGRDLIG